MIKTYEMNTTYYTTENICFSIGQKSTLMQQLHNKR